jgi:large subunit ribosomal protein L10e
MGNLTTTYSHILHLVSRNDLQIRHNALESARVACLRILEGQLGKNRFTLQLRVYPHHILRENPLASGAGADRMSTGMQLSFGKPIGIAARVHKGKTLFTVTVPKENIAVAREGLKAASYKFACRTQIVEEHALSQQ